MAHKVKSKKKTKKNALIFITHHCTVVILVGDIQVPHMCIVVTSLLSSSLTRSLQNKIFSVSKFRMSVTSTIDCRLDVFITL